MGWGVGRGGGGGCREEVKQNREVRVRIVHCFNAFVSYEGNIGRVKEKHREQEGKI